MKALPRENLTIRASRIQIRATVKQVLARETYRAALILLLILNIDFFPCIWGHKTLLESAQFYPSVLPSGAWAGKRVTSLTLPKMLDPAAAASFTEPYMRLTGLEYVRGKTLPLWNPYQGLGQPYAANMQSQPFYPLAMLFSLHITPKAYNLFLLSRLFIAGFGAYLYLRLFVSFIPALTGAIAAMLAGYFLLFISMPHLSVETLIPGALFGAELLLRTPGRRTITIFAIVVALAILGGMPESSFLLYLLVYSYIAFRIIFDANLRRAWLKRTVSVLLATLIGVGLAAFLWMPMVELIHHSSNAHEFQKNGGWIQGTWYERLDPSILTYIFPLLFGQPFAPTLLARTYIGNGTRNFFGMIAFFLVLIALFSARKAETAAERRVKHITYFFFLAALTVVLKRYGFPPVEALGGLPLLRLITLVKYDEPILSVCIAVLCGIGIEQILIRRVSWRVQVAALALAFLLIPASLFISKDLLLKELWTDHVLPVFPLIAIGLPVCLLFCLALCDIVFGSGASLPANGAKRAVYLSACLLILLTAEMSLNYIPELYYVFSKLPNTSENPYAGAPYITWLKANSDDNSRVFARGGALSPDWASAFQLRDVRDLDALYYWKYLPFIRNFLLPPGQLGSVDDFSNRFTGAGGYDYGFTTAVQRRLLQLSSVRYLVSNTPYHRPEFHLVYDGEVKIYAYDPVLPRAALYFRAEVLNNDAQTLEKLADPNFDVFQSVLLNRVQLKPDQMLQVLNLNRGEARPARAGTIVSYAPQSVDVDAVLPQPGILVLNDSDYPGWQVSVDGNASKILSANFMFRGVLLSAGKHRIRFSYRPRSFRFGAGITLATLAGLAVWYFGFPRKALEAVPGE